MKAYVNSRGDEEERIMAIANYLNAEEHLSEAMTKEPHRSRELAEQLDRVRESRQKLVKEWSKGRANPNHWCATKHQINSCYHLHELITNAARDEPDAIPVLADSYKRCLAERDKAVELFMSGDGGESGETCQRCVADLNIGKGVSDIESFKTHESYQTKEDMMVWVILALLLFGVALMAKYQPQQPAT